jgi:hypothetical protein
MNISNPHLITEFATAFQDYDRDTFVVSTEGQKIQVFVNPDLVYKSIGRPPRRIEHKTQDEFHDAYYAWQEKSCQFARSNLEVFSSKIRGTFSKTFSKNAWNKPFLVIE